MKHIIQLSKKHLPWLVLSLPFFIVLSLSTVTNPPISRGMIPRIKDDQNYPDSNVTPVGRDLYPIEENNPPANNPEDLYPVETPIPEPQPLLIIPADWPVGISNNGQIIDLNPAIMEEVEQLISDGQTLQMPPFIPEGLDVAPEIIIGTDDRYPVGNSNDSFPYSAVVYISRKWSEEENLTWCTGWMVGPSTVVTAAHCLYDKIGHNVDPWTHLVTVYPGWNISSIDPEPFGHCYFLQYFVPGEWVALNQPKEYDFGFIRLKCDTGNTSGYLGFTSYEGSGSGKFLQIAGYPQDKYAYGKEMWYSLGSLLHSDPLFTYYNNDTVGGDSGAPVWELGSPTCNTCVLADHSRPNEGLPENSGPRVVGLFLSWLWQERQYITRQVFLPILMSGN